MTAAPTALSSMADFHPGRSAKAVGRRTEVRPAGLLYAGTTVFIAVGAINSQNNLLFWLFGLGVAGLLISGIISGAGLLAIDVDRRVIGTSQVGDQLRVRYRVTNRSRRFPVFGLTIEELPAERPRDPPPRSWARNLAAPRAFLHHVGPGQTLAVTARPRTLRRGRAVLHRFSIASSFPFGLMRKTVIFAQRGQALVLPAPAPVSQFQAGAHANASFAGLASTRVAGTGDEFFGVREYTPGDSPRLIAWKRSARGGELLVRQHAAPAPTKVMLVLELPPADVDDEQAERAVGVVCGLAERLDRAGHAVGLAVPGTGLVRQPASGLRHLHRLQEDLAVVDLHPTSPAPPGRRPARSVTSVVIGWGQGDDRAAHTVRLDGRRLDELLATDVPYHPLLHAVSSGRPAGDGMFDAVWNGVLGTFRRVWRAGS